jgi:hypothetical protein
MGDRASEDAEGKNSERNGIRIPLVATPVAGAAVTVGVSLTTTSLPPPSYLFNHHLYPELVRLMAVDGTTRVASLSRCNHLPRSSISLSESYVPLLPG